MIGSVYISGLSSINSCTWSRESFCHASEAHLGEGFASSHGSEVLVLVRNTLSFKALTPHGTESLGLVSI